MQETTTNPQEQVIQEFEDAIYEVFKDYKRGCAITQMVHRDREIVLHRYLLPTGRRLLEQRYQEELERTKPIDGSLDRRPNNLRPRTGDSQSPTPRLQPATPAHTTGDSVGV